MNFEANELAQIASGYRISKELADLTTIMTLSVPSIEQRNMPITVTKAVQEDWRQTIIEYLKNPDSRDRKLRMQAQKYIILGEELYRISSD